MVAAAIVAGAEVVRRLTDGDYRLTLTDWLLTVGAALVVGLVSAALVGVLLFACNLYFAPKRITSQYEARIGSLKAQRDDAVARLSNLLVRIERTNKVTPERRARILRIRDGAGEIRAALQRDKEPRELIAELERLAAALEDLNLTDGRRFVEIVKEFCDWADIVYSDNLPLFDWLRYESLVAACDELLAMSPIAEVTKR